jgi:nucleoside-diphosphate-sugar epimerase
MQYKSIFITGGAGYYGSRLVPQLLKLGYKVTVYDLMLFGNDFLPKDNKNLEIIKGDIRDIEKLRIASKNHDVFLNLACISNDASFILNEKLSTSINMDAFEPMVLAAKKNGVKLFIYASSSSVYGISSKKNVTEEHELVPITLYNKYKGLCEPILKNNIDKNFNAVIFRPATVCGYAPRQRLDLSVNILTNHAINKSKITVFGGDQLRPNLHIQDYCDVIKLFLDSDRNIINNETFNVGYQNMSILEIAKIVKKVVEKEFNIENLEILRTKSDDDRSYHINSDKIKNILNFQPKFSIEDSVKELCKYFKQNYFPNSFEDPIYHNVKQTNELFNREYVK